MNFPFSHDAFLDVFGAFNSALWPAAAGLWLVTVWTAVGWIRRGSVDRRWLFVLLALHWLWSGVAYHWMYFSEINPAASAFGWAFVVQAVVCGWIAFAVPADATAGTNTRRTIGNALIVYGLAYPFIGLALGLDFPRLPLFAVPCPTTLITAGWLIAVTDTPRFAKVIPLLWAIVGSTAAFQLGIRADLALGVAAGALTLDVLAPNSLTGRATGRIRSATHLH